LEHAQDEGPGRIHQRIHSVVTKLPVDSSVAAVGGPSSPPRCRYVLGRLRTFTSGFEELKLLGDGTPLSADDVVRTL
jgi:hypothetical protein